MQDDHINLLFPSRIIDGLQDLRGEKWEGLVRQIVKLDPLRVERIAFVLLLVRLGGCAMCQSDSFRAMRGCALCSTTTIKRYKGSDELLIAQYNDAKVDLQLYLDEVEK